MNLDLVKEVTPHDVIDIAPLLPMAKKSVETEEYLLTVYAFLENGECIEVYHHDMQAGNHCYPEVEYITRHEDGSLHWEAHHYHVDYDLEIDRDDIFELYKSTYLIKEGCPLYGKNSRDFSNEGALSLVASLFKDFVESLQ